MDFSDKIDNLANLTDFGEYINLLKLGLNLIRYQPSSELQKTLQKLYFAYFTFVDRPSLFDDSKQLNEVDRLHIEFYESFPFYFVYGGDPDREQYRLVTNRLLK